jgi:hypothetical protein
MKIRDNKCKSQDLIKELYAISDAEISVLKGAASYGAFHF